MLTTKDTKHAKRNCHERAQRAHGFQPSASSLGAVAVHNSAGHSSGTGGFRRAIAVGDDVRRPISNAEFGVRNRAGEGLVTSTPSIWTGNRSGFFLIRAYLRRLNTTGKDWKKVLANRWNGIKSHKIPSLVAGWKPYGRSKSNRVCVIFSRILREIHALLISQVAKN